MRHAVLIATMRPAIDDQIVGKNKIALCPGKGATNILTTDAVAFWYISMWLKAQLLNVDMMFDIIIHNRRC